MNTTTALPEFLPKRVLLYKRTHVGDPSKDGVFGHENCMGRIRDYSFDSVIGLGGKKPWSNQPDIARRVTWVGVGAQKRANEDAKRASKVTFEWCRVVDELGPKLEDISPFLYDELFVKRPRWRYMIVARKEDDRFSHEVFDLIRKFRERMTQR